MSYEAPLTSGPGAEGVDVAVLTQPEAVAGGHGDLVLCAGLEAGQLEAACVLPGLGAVGGLSPVSPGLGSVQLNLHELPLLRARHSEANNPPCQDFINTPPIPQ